MKDFEHILGYTFTDPDLLVDALTHTSLDANTPSPVGYERLEFLGDRVLGLVIADMLLKRHPEEAEGEIARRHAAVVQRGALADVARGIGLGDHLRLAAAERTSGGADKDTILANTMEAVIGAVYLDGGLSPAAAFIERNWTGLLDHYTEPPKDPKTGLQEIAQAEGKPLPVYTVLERTGPDHAPEFEVEVAVEGLGTARATSTNKRQAEKLAAEKLLEKLGSD